MAIGILGGGGGGGGSGGGGGTTVTATKITRTTFSVDMNFVDSDDFESPPGIPAWPAGAIEARINFGGVDASSAGTAEWGFVTKVQFDEWTAAVDGGSPTDSTGIFFRDFTANAPASVTSTARDFFIGKDADDKLLFASSTTSEDAYPLTIIWFKEEDVDIVSGGGGAAPGWIEPKDEYVEDDLHKFLIENGALKHIVLETQVGHSRVVDFQTLANAVSALDADGNHVSTGEAGDFLGFFPNLSGIPALSITDGSWAAFIGAGDFEIQDPTGFYSSEHWNSYNPFRGSGTRPWATITLADATTQDHVAFTDPDTGVVSDWRIVNTSGHAERFTTAIGEAFFIQDEQKIKMVTAYTPHEEGEVRYVSEPWIPGGVVRPMIRFWGAGQTSEENGGVPVARVQSSTPVASNFAYRYQFNQAEPDEIIIGDDDLGVEMLAAADVPAGSIRLMTVGTAETAVLDYQILKLPVGTWRLWFTANHRETGDTSVAGYLYEANGTDDDELLVHRASGYAVGLPDPFNEMPQPADQLAMNIRMHNIIIENSEVEYLTVISLGFGDAAGIAGVHSLMLEKLR